MTGKRGWRLAKIVKIQDFNWNMEKGKGGFSKDNRFEGT